MELQNVNDKPWIDYTSLSLLMSCPRKYYWRVVREITTSEVPPALLNGIAYHEALATYYKCKQAGTSHDESVDLALKSCVPFMKKIQVEDKKRNLTTAFEVLSHYFNFWRDESYSTIKVEVKFAVDLREFLYVGRIDRYAEHPAFGKLVMESKTTGVWPPTWKSTKRKWEIKGRPNFQLDGYVASIYILTGELPSGGVLDVIPVYDKTPEPPFRIITLRQESDIDNWISDVQDWWVTLMRYRNNGDYPCNTDTCVPIYGGFECDFLTLCKAIPNPRKTPDAEIPLGYVRDPWLPFSELAVLKEDRKGA